MSLQNQGQYIIKQDATEVGRGSDRRRRRRWRRSYKIRHHGAVGSKHGPEDRTNGTAELEVKGMEWHDGGWIQGDIDLIPGIALHFP